MLAVLKPQPAANAPTRRLVITMPAPMFSTLIALISHPLSAGHLGTLLTRSERYWQYLTFFPFLLGPCILGLDAAQKFAWVTQHHISASLALGFWGIWSFTAAMNPVWLYAGHKDLITKWFPPRLWAAIANVAV